MEVINKHKLLAELPTYIIPKEELDPQTVIKMRTEEGETIYFIDEDKPEKGTIFFDKLGAYSYIEQINEKGEIEYTGERAYYLRAEETQGAIICCDSNILCK